MADRIKGITIEPDGCIRTTTVSRVAQAKD